LPQPASFGGIRDGIDESSRGDTRNDDRRSIVPTVSEQFINTEAMMVSALKI
jgi:hypothetical protein